MLGKTHMAVGTAAGLLIMQPQNITELILGTGAAMIGSVISDIDIGTPILTRRQTKSSDLRFLQ